MQLYLVHIHCIWWSLSTLSHIEPTLCLHWHAKLSQPPLYLKLCLYMVVIFEPRLWKLKYISSVTSNLNRFFHRVMFFPTFVLLISSILCFLESLFYFTFWHKKISFWHFWKYNPAVSWIFFKNLKQSQFVILN